MIWANHKLSVSERDGKSGCRRNDEDDALAMRDLNNRNQKLHSQPTRPPPTPPPAFTPITYHLHPTTMLLLLIAIGDDRPGPRDCVYQNSWNKHVHTTHICPSQVLLHLQLTDCEPCAYVHKAKSNTINIFAIKYLSLCLTSSSSYLLFGKRKHSKSLWNWKGRDEQSPTREHHIHMLDCSYDACVQSVNRACTDFVPQVGALSSWNYVQHFYRLILWVQYGKFLHYGCDWVT